MSALKIQLATAVVIVLLAATYMAYMAITQSASQNHRSASSALGATAPENGVLFSSVANGIFSNISRSRELNVSYAGTVTILGNSGSLNDVMPANISYERYNGSSRIMLGLSNVPIVGSLGVILIHAQNGTYFSCIKYGSSASGQQYGLTYGNYTCNASNSISLGPGGGTYSINNLTSAYAQSNVYVTFGNSRVYGGHRCSWIYGAGNQSVASPTGGSGVQVSLRYNISGCLSLQYYVPLNISALLSWQSQYSGVSGLAMDLHMESIGAPTTAEGVLSLPGPLANSSRSPEGGLALNGSSTLNNTCISLLGFQCGQLSLYKDGKLTFMFGQSTGSTLYGIKLACSIGNQQPTYEPIDQLGVPQYNVTGTALQSGSTLLVSNLTCSGYNSSMSSGVVQVRGAILVNYTASQQTSQNGTRWYALPAAEFSTYAR